MPDWIKRKDVGLVQQSAAFSAGVNADPSLYGISPETAADLAAKQSAFAAAFQIANQNATNSTTAVVQKDAARRSLVEIMRQVAGVIRWKPGLAFGQLCGVGLRPKESRRKRVNGPGSTPWVSVLSVTGRVVTVRVFDPENTTRQSKPRDVSAIAVFGFVGNEPPTHGQQWRPLPTQTKTTFQVAFNSAHVKSGDKVWITAAWLGTRQQPGPTAPAAYTYVSGAPMFKLPVLPAA